MDYGDFERETAPVVPEAAPLLKRILAGLIDVAVLIAVLVVVTLVSGRETAGSEDGGATLVLVLATLAYFFLFEGGDGSATPGKRFIGLKVVMADDGTDAGYGPASLRTMLRLVDGFPAGYAVGILTILLTKRSQRLGDLVAATLVVETERR